MPSCTYCGDAATTLDHVVPYSWNHVGKRKSKAGRHGRGPKVPCCVECNSLLGATPLFTVEDRRDFIADKLGRRVKAPVVWDDEELDELGPGLRSFVVCGNARDATNTERLSYANSPS